jgi:hypothetical protein
MLIALSPKLEQMLGRPRQTTQKRETAAPQGLFNKFPKKNIREIFLKNREF